MKITSETPSEPGTYVIRVPNGKDYIGSSGDMRRRLRNHSSELNRGIHPCKELQSAFNQCGGVVDVIIYPTATKEEALEHEQAILDHLMPQGTLYNKATDAYVSTTGLSMPWSEERKKITSEKYKTSVLGAQKVEAMTAANLGVPKTDEHKDRISAAHKTSEKAIAARTIVQEARKVPVVIEGVAYPSIGDASKEIGMNYSSVTTRIRSKNFPDWRKA